MSLLKSWYDGRRVSGSGSGATSIAPTDKNNKTAPSSSNNDETSSTPPPALQNMSEISRAVAEGKVEAGEHFADMALGDGFGALVAFEPTSPPSASDSTFADDTPPVQQVSTDSELIEPFLAEEETTEAGEHFTDMALGDGFGALVAFEPTHSASASTSADENPSSKADKSADIPGADGEGAMYSEVAKWLAINVSTSDAKEASVSVNIDDKKRRSLYQRIDQYLFPPSKLIADGTLVPPPTEAKSNNRGNNLEVDFPRKKRERRLIGTGLGSVGAAAVGAVSRRASQATSEVSKSSSVPPAPTLRSNQVLLWGATTVDAHYHQIRHVLETVRAMHGAVGLRAVGFEYRMVPCPAHAVCHDEECEGSADGRKTTTDKEGRDMYFIQKSKSHLDDTKPDQVQRIRSQSDAGVPYGGSGSLHDDKDVISMPCSSPSSHDHHQMITVPSHAPSVGDLVESAAIRERKVRGFAESDRESRLLSRGSETSLSTVFGNSDSDDEGEDDGSSQAKESEGERLLEALSEELDSAIDEGKDIFSSPSGEYDVDPNHCFECFTRLFHIESNTMITEENLNRYIAHGDMYDEIARMCQEQAQDKIMEEGGLVWVTICDDNTKGNPIRALVDEDHSKRPGPILLVITGKGKVRAGVFSRRHILTSGIECSTALPMVREAKRRKMRVALLDPNARGDREGMMTFEASVRALFGHQEWNKDEGEEEMGPYTSQYFNPHLHQSPMYVLAHSASGAQLVRYLMDQANLLLPRIAAIVFTDSTHNIQWTKKHESLQRLLESPACVYVRSANARHDDNWQTYRAGDIVETDHHWRRRFGSVQTLWAGTAEHSLMNWTSHRQIWSHFDQHIFPQVYQGVASIQAAIDQSIQDDDNKGHAENAEKNNVAGDHEDRSVSSNGSLPHRKRERSVDIITL